jgi:hypothetical protein
MRYYQHPLSKVKPQRVKQLRICDRTALDNI